MFISVVRLIFSHVASIMTVRLTLRPGTGPLSQLKVSLAREFCLHPAQKPIHSFIADGKPEAYFRGRKLRGQEIQVPQGYRGIVVEEAGRETTAFQTTEKGVFEQEEGEQIEEAQEEVTMLNELGSFDRLLIWNHESMVDGDDLFIRGLSEWISFAEAVSGVFSVCG